MSAETVSQTRSPWRYFPHWLIGSMLIVVAVNVYMAWNAIVGFPGHAVEDDFGVSNRYDQILAKAEQQAALGWTITPSQQAGYPVITLTAPGGQPIEGADITAHTSRPVGPPATVTQLFTPIAPGIYRADLPLTQSGKWDLMLRVRYAGHSLDATKRILVP